jgi:enoyl-CoA hydratase/carnithine racemase
MTDKLVTHSLDGLVYTITLSRPASATRSATACSTPWKRHGTRVPAEARVVILAGAGEHFCAGLDLSEHQHREPSGVMLHSQGWHRVFGKIHQTGIPVVAVLHGAVIGGGLELATSTHVRVAERTPSTSCPKAATASMSAVAPRCAWRASSAPAAWPR